MSVGSWLTGMGAIAAFTGLSIEAVAAAGMAFYPVRHALPFKSPVVLLSYGCWCLIVGLVLLGAGQASPK